MPRHWAAISISFQRPKGARGSAGRGGRTWRWSLSIKPSGVMKDHQFYYLLEWSTQISLTFSGRKIYSFFKWLAEMSYIRWVWGEGVGRGDFILLIFGLVTYVSGDSRKTSRPRCSTKERILIPEAAELWIIFSFAWTAVYLNLLNSWIQ